MLASIASLECFPEQLPVAPLDALGALDPESGFQVPAPALIVFLHHGPYARLRRGPLFRVRRRLAGPHQHVPEVGHGRSNEVKESIEVSSTQGGRPGQQGVAALRIPTVGIGAGPGCDAQILVWQDMAGLTTGRLPTFVKPYGNMREGLLTAARQYASEVAAGSYPDQAHSYV